MNSGGQKTGIKRLNTLEVGQRAKAFATRKVGGMGGAAGMTFKQQQAAVRAGLSKPPRYSTQTPNRNKPGPYDRLGQSEQRRRLRAADSILQKSAATAGRAGNAAAADTARQIAVSARGRIASAASSVKPQPRLQTKASTAAPDNARTRANRLRTMQNRVKYFRQEPDAPNFKKAATARNAAFAARVPGTTGKVVFRSANRAKSRYNMQATDLTTRVRYNLQNARPGMSSATGGGGRTGVRRTDTGMRQLALMGGKPKALYSAKRVAVKRPSGKRRYS